MNEPILKLERVFTLSVNNISSLVYNISGFYPNIRVYRRVQRVPRSRAMPGHASSIKIVLFISCIYIYMYFFFLNNVRHVLKQKHFNTFFSFNSNCFFASTCKFQFNGVATASCFKSDMPSIMLFLSFSIIEKHRSPINSFVCSR